MFKQSLAVAKKHAHFFSWKKIKEIGISLNAAFPTVVDFNTDPSNISLLVMELSSLPFVCR